MYNENSNLDALPEDISLGVPKFKAFTDEILHASQMTGFVLCRLKNIVEKRRKCW